MFKTLTLKIKNFFHFNTFNFNIFTNKDLFVLNNVFTYEFFLLLVFLFNVFLFLTVNCKIKKLLTTILNLIISVIFIVNIGNEAFAYIFLISELTAIVIFSSIILSNKNLEKKKINFYFINIFIILFLFMYFYLIFFNNNTNINDYCVFLSEPAHITNTNNDFYSLFIFLNKNYKIQLALLSYFFIVSVQITILVFLKNNLKFWIKFFRKIIIKLFVFFINIFINRV